MTPLVIVIALVCSRNAFAQQAEHREWQVSLFAGGSFIPNSSFPTPVSGSIFESSRTVGLRYEPGYLLGFRMTQNLDDYWAVDLEYSFANQRVRFLNLSPTIQNLLLSHQIHRFSYDVSYLPRNPLHRLRPYGVAGIGAGLFFITGGAKNDALDAGIKLRDSWEFVFQYGGGLKWVVRDPYVLTFDVKDYMSRVPSYGIPPSARVVGDQLQPGMAIHGVLHNFQIGVGFTYQWDEF